MEKILIFIAILLPSVLLAKGYEGEYIIQGIMYDKATKLPLANQEFVINGKKIKTDKEGKYSFIVKWSTVCPSNLSYFKRQKFIKKANPRYLIFQHNGISQKVRNKWRKFGLKYHWGKKTGILVKHLYW